LDGEFFAADENKCLYLATPAAKKTADVTLQARQ
jgi:hypothetical protein